MPSSQSLWVPSRKIKVIWMNGMGADSFAAFYNWMTNPSSRYFILNGQRYEFELEDVISLTSQTGLEWRWTGEVVERYLYPRMRTVGIRTVQIGKAQPGSGKKYEVLEDTTQPRRCWIRGRDKETYFLDEMLLDAGTVPQYQNGRRDCSVEFKGRIQETWVVDQFQEELAELDAIAAGESPPGGEEGEEREEGSAVGGGGEGYFLDRLLLESGALPQRASKNRACSDTAKREPSEAYLNDREWEAGEAEAAGGLTLDQNLLEAGVVPQYAEGRRKCSDLHKRQPCNNWVEDESVTEGVAGTGSSPPVVSDPDNEEPEGYQLNLFQSPGQVVVPQVMVAINFNANEQYRIDRAEFGRQKAELKKQQRKRKPKVPEIPRIIRTDFYPPHQEGWSRIQDEYAASQLADGNVVPRSACNACPFAKTNGGNTEVLEKHRRSPDESGYALAIEHISRRLNPRQTITRSGSLYDVILADGNTAAIANMEDRLDRLEWGVYRVQRIYAAIPWRKTTILARGPRWQIEAALFQHAEALGYTMTNEPDGLWRGYTAAPMNCEDLLTICPTVVKEKCRKGFAKMWAGAMQLEHLTEQVIH